MVKAKQTDLFDVAEFSSNTGMDWKEGKQYFFDRLKFEQGNNKRNKARANAQRAKKRKEKNGKIDI